MQSIIQYIIFCGFGGQITQAKQDRKLCTTVTEPDTLGYRSTNTEHYYYKQHSCKNTDKHIKQTSFAKKLRLKYENYVSKPILHPPNNVEYGSNTCSVIFVSKQKIA